MTFQKVSSCSPADVLNPGIVLLTMAVACCSFSTCFCNCTLVESSLGVNRSGEMAGGNCCE